MFKPVHGLIVIALALGGTQRLGASQVLWLAACDGETPPHRDALTDAVEGALNDGDDAALEAHGPQDSTPQPNQQPPADKNRAHKWWLSEEGKTEFGISDQQSRDLETLFQQMLPSLKANKTELDKQEKVLDQLLSSGSSTEAVVAQAIDRVESARSALSRTRTLMLYRMYRLLTPEQRAKVQAYHERKAQEADGRTARR
jgi:Spy/CpxP family protein refolding chaperone